MKIAIIDDGFNKNLIDKSLNITEYISFSGGGIKRLDPHSQSGMGGAHGSAVLNTISKYAPHFSCFDFRMYSFTDNNKTGSGHDVARALEYIHLNNIPDILILCLTITNKSNIVKCEEIFKELFISGCVIIGSGAMEKENVFPASSKQCIGVERGISQINGDFICIDRNNIRFSGNCQPEWIRYGDSFFMFKGTSKAVASLGGIYAEFCIRNNLKPVNSADDFISYIETEHNNLNPPKKEHFLKKQNNIVITPIILNSLKKQNIDHTQFTTNELLRMDFLALTETEERLLGVLSDIMSESDLDITDLNFFDFITVGALDNYLRRIKGEL